MDPKVTPVTPAAGLILHDRYRVVRPIGRGGMGTVYEAIDLRLRNVVAVKQMTAAGFEADQAFEREAALLASLRHASLPVVIDYFIDEMGRFFVMQYIDGEDLSDLLSRQQAPCLLEEVRSWALTLLETLDYLHSHAPPIVHRDIKPSNLRLTARGELILLDFGLAKGRAVPHVSWTAFEKSIFGFTPRYSPPEQLLGGVTTPQSDLYALGATLYYLATGTAPPHAGDRAHARSAGLPDPLVSAHQVNADLPVGFSNILGRALALDPAERFASALEMRLALLEDGSVTRPFSRVAPVSNRRVDAALPSRAEVGRHIDLVVQVRFADSPRLGLEDWPTRRRPAAIEQESAAVRVVYPVDRQSGAFLPARLRLRIVAPDFAIDGETERLIEAPPDDYSTRIVFLVSAIKEGYCRLNVEVYGPDAVYLGAIPLEAEAFTVSDAASQLRVGHMVLILTSASLIDGMSRVTQEGFGPAPTVRQAKAPSRARREVSSRKSSGLRQLGATAVVVLVAGALWISLLTRRTPTPVTAGSQPTTQASPPVSGQPAPSAPARTGTPPAENRTAAGRPVPQPPAGIADPLEARRPAAGGPTGSAPPPTLAEPLPVLSPDVVARQEILRLVETYCAAYDKLSLQSLRTVFRTGDLSPIPKLLLDDPNLRCTSTPPEFERLDASASGSARLHFTMTHAAASSRSQPDTTDRYVIMEVSRRDSANPWLIDRILVADPSPR